MISKQLKIYHLSDEFNRSIFVGCWFIFLSVHSAHYIDCIGKNNYYIYTDHTFGIEGFATYQEIEKYLKELDYL